jgi:hypothetical protein
LANEEYYFVGAGKLTVLKNVLRQGKLERLLIKNAGC